MASCHTHAATHNRDREARRRKDSREEGGVGGVSKLPYSKKITKEVCQNSLILKKSQSPDFHKPGLCYV